MAAENVAFRTLCLFTHNRFNYHLDDDRHSSTVEALIDYLDSLAEDHDIVPVTLAGAHDHWMRSA
jgi:hypothetical protein